MNEVADNIEKAEYLLRHSPEHLQRALAQNEDASLGLKDRLHVTQSLVAYGQVAASEESLARLDGLVHQVRGADQLAEKFRKQLEILKKFSISEKLKKNESQESALLDPEKPVFFENPKRKGLIIVFATNFNNFEVSFPVLHCILENYGYSIFYLKDAKRRFYLTGIPGIAEDFKSLLGTIAKLKQERGGDRLVVMGHSSSGYTGLLSSILLQADSFIGCSIRSDLSRTSTLSPGLLMTEEVRSDIPRKYLTDLRPLLMEREFPRSGRIYFGEHSRLDADHAKRLAGNKRVDVLKVNGANHSVMSSLIGNGEFGAVLRSVLT